MTKQQAGHLGGCVTVQKYGKMYMRKLGKKGAVAFWLKYKLVPTGTSNFAIVNRETDVAIGYTNGWRM